MLCRGVPAYPRVLGQRGVAVILRVLMGVLFPAGALLQGWGALAGGFLFLNLFLDRFLFYGLAVRCDTEAEVARVEAALRAGAHSPMESLDSSPTFIRAGDR